MVVKGLIFSFKGRATWRQGYEKGPSGMGTRRKSSRPRGSPPETETTPRRWLHQPRRDQDDDNFSQDETETRRWYVSRPRRRDRDHNPGSPTEMNLRKNAGE